MSHTLLAKFRKQILKFHKAIAYRTFTCPILWVVWPHRGSAGLSFLIFVLLGLDLVVHSFVVHSVLGSLTH